MSSIFNSKLRCLMLVACIVPGLATARPNIHIPHGLYFGTSAAITSNKINNRFEFDPLEIEDAYLYFRNQYASNTQVQPGFLLGYEYMLSHNWMVSGEFQFNFLPSYVSVGGSDFHENMFTTNNQYALQLRLGKGLTPDDNFIYLLIGVARTTTDAKIVFDNTNLTEGTLGDLQLGTVDKSQDLTGLKLGVGYEKRINQDYAIRFDYSHTQYGTFKTDLNDPIFADIFPEPMGTSTVSQSTDMLGISLLFLT